MALITGNLLTLVGGIPTLARLWFQLSRPGWSAATGDIYAPEFVEAVADTTTGAFSINLTRTDQIDGDVAYYAVLKWRDIDGAEKARTLGSFGIEGPGPFELSDLLVSGPFDPVPEDLLALIIAAEAAATQAAEAAADALENVETYAAVIEDSVQYQYLWDDDAGRGAQTGMTTGQRGYVRATEHVWHYDGSAWVDDGLAPTASKAETVDLDAEVLARQELIAVATGAGRHSVGDPDGFAAAVIDRAGVTHHLAHQVGTVQRRHDPVLRWPVVVMDAAGYAVEVLDDSGARHQGSVAPLVSRPRPPRHAARMVAHRGLTIGGAFAPENSLDALRLAAQAGFEWVEIDVNATSDGQLVLLHDDTIARTLRLAAGYAAISPDVNIWNVSLASLRSTYVIAAEQPQFRRPVPTLAEALTACRALGLKPVVELKPSLSAARVTDTAHLAMGICGLDGCAISGFDWGDLDIVRGLYPQASIWYQAAASSAAIADLASRKPAVLQSVHTSWTPALVAEAHRAGIGTSAYTVPPAAEAALVAMGLDTLLTDYGAPPPDPAQIVARIDSTGGWAGIGHTGVLTAGRVVLAAGQSLTWAPDITVPFGVALAAVEYTGAIEVSGSFSLSLSNSTGQFQHWHQSRLLDQATPSLTLTAGTGGAVIQSCAACAAEY